MKFRTALVSTVATVALTAGFVSATQAQAAPAPADIGYQAEVVGDHVVLTTDIGSLRTSGNQFEIVDAAGKVAASIPLLYNLEDQQFPILADITGRTATLTPVQDPAVATKIVVSNAVLDQATAPETRQERDMQALQTLGSQVGTAVTIGSLIGAIIGAGIGCVVLIATGCLPGLVTGAGIGGLIGTIVVGGPALIVAAIQYFNTINSPLPE